MIDYWHMSDEELCTAWSDATAQNIATDYDGTVTETIAFVEDAILQRIDAPEDASGDEPYWQERIREWAKIAGQRER